MKCMNGWAKGREGQYCGEERKDWDYSVNSTLREIGGFPSPRLGCSGLGSTTQASQGPLRPSALPSHRRSSVLVPRCSQRDYILGPYLSTDLIAVSF